MSAAEKNKDIWDSIYEGGALLWYPAEALVRLVRRREREGGFAGTILDHGCGSGNVTEFLVRSGHRVHCTDISPVAIELLKRRFRDTTLPCPETTLIDLEQPLSPQLPAYNHVVAWQSIYYGTRDNVRQSLQTLIQGLPAGGVLIVSLPTPRDLAWANSEEMPDGSRRFVGNTSNQNGAILTIPETAEEFASWCRGVEVKDVVEYGMRFDGVRSEFFVLYGVKP